MKTVSALGFIKLRYSFFCFILFFFSKKIGLDEAPFPSLQVLQTENIQELFSIQKGMYVNGGEKNKQGDSVLTQANSLLQGSGERPMVREAPCRSGFSPCHFLYPECFSALPHVPAPIWSSRAWLTWNFPNGFSAALSKGVSAFSETLLTHCLCLEFEFCWFSFPSCHTVNSQRPWTWSLHFCNPALPLYSPPTPVSYVRRWSVLNVC